MQININNVKRRKPQADITNSEKWVRNKNEMNAGPQLMHVLVCVCVRVLDAPSCVCVCLCVHMFIFMLLFSFSHVCCAFHGEINMFVLYSLSQNLFPCPHLFPLFGSWVWLAAFEWKICVLGVTFIFVQLLRAILFGFHKLNKLRVVQKWRRSWTNWKLFCNSTEGMHAILLRKSAYWFAWTHKTLFLIRVIIEV